MHPGSEKVSPELNPDTGDYLSFDDLSAQFYEMEPQVTVEVEFGAKSHPGNVRPNNEDNFLVVRRSRNREVMLTSLGEGLLEDTSQAAYTLAVADGMGGQQFGEIASLLALRSGWELGGEEVKWTLKVNDREVAEMEQKARVFFQKIHRTIRAEADMHPRLHGMGTTLTLCYTTGPELFVMHAGDSRAYLLRGSDFKRLTRDHSLAQAMIDNGAVKAGSPEEKRVRHVLLNSLGANAASVEVDVDHQRLEHSDQLMLCTDGLTDMVPEDQIAEILRQPIKAQEAAEALVDKARERGGKDNVTVVIARYTFVEPPKPPQPSDH